MDQRLQVSLSGGRLFCPNDALKRKKSESAESEASFDAAGTHPLKITYAGDLVQAIQFSEIGLQVEILKCRGQLPREFKGEPARRKSVKGMEVVNGSMKLLQIWLIKGATNIQIESRHTNAMINATNASDHNELHLRILES
jgi:hypothetical protein